MENKNFKIGIVGLGMVGGTLRRYFEEKKFETFFYDNGKNEGSVELINKSDIVFICVPTPFDKKTGFDLSYVEDACSKLAGGKIVVIKSTILPGSTEKLQKKYPQHKFLFNPEFLTEATADNDMKNPSRQIIGYTQESKNLAEEVLNILPMAPFMEIMPVKEAEMVKYFSNNWYAIKVIYCNQVYDLCRKLGIDYETVKRAAAADKMIGSSHLEIFHKGYRGYGGKCLPKDIRALIKFADENDIDLKLHKTAEEINNELSKNEK